MTSSLGMARVKRGNKQYMVTEVEALLREAPGRPVPPAKKSRRMSKHEIADAEISRCTVCGDWHNNPKPQCNWCSKNPFPIIDDIERTT